MDGKTLLAAMGYAGYPAPLTLDRYTQLASPCRKALARAQCNTVARAAMFLAQIGAESGSLRWTEELADGSAYEGRADLGNYVPGDGHRFKGRSFIQVTGRSNYSKLSIWAHSEGYVPTASYFIDHPTRLADDAYAFLGPVWYWTVARNMNKYADAHDIEGATRAVNGGLNGFAGRRSRWEKCLTLGDSLIPASGPSSSTHHPISKKEPAGMFEILYDQDTKVWYAWAPGYWHRFGSAADLSWAAVSPLCINGAKARAVLAKPTARNLATFGISNAHTVQRKQMALGG